MKIVFMRHGFAEMPRAGRPDFERRLTKQGIHYLQQEAIGVTKLALNIKKIYHSPLVRATQTAEIMSLGLGVSTEMLSELACGCTFDKLSDILDVLELPDSFMIVGHQPDLGQMMFELTGATLHVQPGTIMVAETSAFKLGEGRLIGHYMPEDLM